MQLARVIGTVVSSEHHHAYDGRKLLMVRTLDANFNDTATTNIAVDYVGAGQGEIVLVGAAPGLASVVFKVPGAPITEMVMGIVDPALLPKE